MITKFNSIKKVGCYEDLSTNANKPFDKVNILFGNNGSGKTTFSNILYLLSKHCKDKQTLFDELTESDSEIEIETTGGKISLKNIIASELDIYVFNSKFVSDSVYNGNTSNIDSFSNEIKERYLGTPLWKWALGLALLFLLAEVLLIRFLK